MVTTLFMAIAGPIFSQPLEQGRDLFTRSVDAFFDEAASVEELRSWLGRSRILFTSLDDECLGWYWMARVDYTLGLIERGQDNESESEELFQRSLMLAERSLDCAPTSDTHRVVADAYAQLMPYRGVFYAMRYGRRIMEHAQRAVELDSRNARAQLTLALSYLHAPAFAGGSVEHCVLILKKLENRPDLPRLERFSVHTWLGIAYDKVGDYVLAAQHLERAAEVYPGNSWVRELISADPSD
jgi:tetratricopeptide (TPR) repeat protein